MVALQANQKNDNIDADNSVYIIFKPNNQSIIKNTKNMNRTLRRLSLVMIATALVFTGCKKDQEEENNGGNGGGGATTGTINGHEWVDLGLPSGTKWATCNVGANTPEGYGNYYAWGETTTKSEYTLDNSRTYGKNMTDISGNATYDAARANWGSTWRMPTKAEMQELENNCTWTWTAQSGINGYKVTGPNGNSIFLTAAGYCEGTSHDRVGEYGYYWSSSPDESDGSNACSFYFGSGYHGVHWALRNFGRTVRPVLK